MIVTTAEESRSLDRSVIEKYGLPEDVLMENAGASVVRLTEDAIRWAGASVTILCGTGNNGGDGMVTARYAAEAGAGVLILLMGNPAHMGQSAQHFRKAAEVMGIPVIPVSRADEAIPYLEKASIIVDALVGTGMKGTLGGEKAKIISAVNTCEAITISVDIPSGMSADTGRAEGPVIMADYTIALGTWKRGHVLYPGSEYSGKVLYSSIGIPDAARSGLLSSVSMTETEDVAAWLPIRSRISHKGENGSLGIFAGSSGMEGAGLLAAQGALYGGAGKVTLVTPEEPARELAGLIPEVMVTSLAGHTKMFCSSMAETAAEQADGFDAAAVGCGLGRSPETQKFVEIFLRLTETPLVVDADALYAVAALKLEPRDCPGHWIMTPHVGEFSRLCGCTGEEIEKNRIESARDYAQKHQVILVLKGAPTVTALPDGQAWLNSTGNPGMAAGGMGDTLTGITAALAGQGMKLPQAAAAAVYLHGLAADLLAEKTPVGFTASQVAEMIPRARYEVSRE